MRSVAAGPLRRRLAVTAVVGLTAAFGALAASDGVAWGEPLLKVPDSGTARLTWQGTVQPGTNGNGNVGTLRCFSDTNPLADEFGFQLSVPANFFATHRVLMRIHIGWHPNTNAQLNDLDLTTWRYDANSQNIYDIQDSTHSATTVEDTVYGDPVAATGDWTYRAGVCPSTNGSPQSYSGSVTVTVTKFAGQPVRPGVERFANYETPAGYETRDGVKRWNAGEPSIGVDRRSGAVMYMAGTQVSRVTFNDRYFPARASWKDVTPVQQLLNEDAILSVDSATGRTWEVGLLLACSNVGFSDDDGKTWTPSNGCPVPHSPDHETLGSGPFAADILAPTNPYGRAVYYCSQNVLQGAGAFCGISRDGGRTFGVSSQVFGVNSPCGAIHGHVKVSPDGTVYLPQKACYTSTGQLGQGMAVSRDNGLTWSYATVPDSLTSLSDPSVAPSADNTLYYGYRDGTGVPMVAVSSNHGRTWSPSVDVGAPFGIKNAEFPELIAGDAGRAAMAFIGTTTGGDDQADGFSGVWNLYIAFTYNRGASWYTVNATAGDPLQRGCVWMQGGSSNCRNLLDFNEISVDKQGRVVASYTDGCTGYCISHDSVTTLGCPSAGALSTTSDSTPSCTYGKHAALVRQTCGRGLFAAYDSKLVRGCFRSVFATSATGAAGLEPGGGVAPATAQVRAGSEAAPAPRLVALLTAIKPVALPIAAAVLLGLLLIGAGRRSPSIRR